MEMKKMNIDRNKSKVSTIALILLLTVSAIIVALPVTIAQWGDPTITLTCTSYAYIGATPNPVGVNQDCLIHVGMTQERQDVSQGWEGLTVTLTDPEGIETTLGPYRTDATGGTGDLLKPDKIGTYKLQTHFPAQWGNWSAAGWGDAFEPGADIWWEADDSEVLELVVVETQQEFWPGIPLPTEYWSRPIDGQLREWSAISGNWLGVGWEGGGTVALYNDGPETAHILWAKPIALGGLTGGESGVQAYEEGDAYEGKFENSVIINGVLYYNRYTQGTDWAGGIWPVQGIVAVDLRTGEELWFRNNTRLHFGQTFYWDSYNYHGVFAYLWETVEAYPYGPRSTWIAYDPFNGEFAYRMINVPDGTNIYGPKGEIYRYTVDLENGLLSLWNSSRVISDHGSWGSIAHRQETFDATNGIEWTVPIPTGLPGSVMAVYLEDRIIGASLGDLYSHNYIISGKVNQPVPLWSISLKTGEEGVLLYNTTWTQPPGDLFIEWEAASLEDGVFTLWNKQLRQHWGFNMDTGQLMWGPTPSQDYLDLFRGGTGHIAYGRLLSVGMSGNIYCYNVTTGTLLWTYAAVDPFNEVLWSNAWSIRPTFFADGKMYLGQSEHSPVDPKPRGGPFVCIDVETGDEVFRVDGLFRQNDWGGLAVIGDSIIATMDSYDNRIYAIGKGPSATTVTASPKVTVQGSSVVFEGSVTDISAGTLDYDLAARFPNGVPAVSDDDMSEWMLHVYKQFPCPADVEGVEVKLMIRDPNGDYYETTVTSDGNGVFSHMWAPSIVGDYHVTAVFEGSKSYYTSYATTTFGIDQAPAAAYPDVPTADEIAQATVNRIPAYPDVPTASEVAQETVNQMPAYPDMPEMPEIPEIPEIPAYLTIDLVIIAAVAIGIIIGLYGIVKKQK
jgi:hypothetical protein